MDENGKNFTCILVYYYNHSYNSKSTPILGFTTSVGPSLLSFDSHLRFKTHDEY